jgi:uncharacterized membrane protein YkvA (DUF1232 family)
VIIHTLGIVVLVLVGLLALVGLAVVGFAAYARIRYRVPWRGVVAAVGALAYLVSPLDVAQDTLLGPVGVAGDAGILGLVLFYLTRLIAARRAANSGEAPRPKRQRQG